MKLLKNKETITFNTLDTPDTFDTPDTRLIGVSRGIDRVSGKNPRICVNHAGLKAFGYQG